MAEFKRFGCTKMRVKNPAEKS